MKIYFVNNKKKKYPNELFQLLKKYSHEFGSTYLNNHRNAALDLYEIMDIDTNCMLGYFWLNSRLKNGAERFDFCIIVCENYRKKGIAKAALNKAKEILREKGIQNIYAQVNCNNHLGNITRNWLLREGFRVLEKREIYSSYTDIQYIEKYSGPIEFILEHI